jgi:hypothetical protein
MNIQEIHALKVINDPDYGSKMFIWRILTDKA